jgi:hypothetical protein
VPQLASLRDANLNVSPPPVGETAIEVLARQRAEDLLPLGRHLTLEAVPAARTSSLLDVTLSVAALLRDPLVALRAITLVRRAGGRHEGRFAAVQGADAGRITHAVHFR